MFNGKMKAITFSYDDGVTQDIRLIELFNKYGMKGTFNINSGLLGRPGSLVRDGVQINHTKNREDEVRQIYAGHEIAVHSVSHPNLNNIADPNEIIREVEEDRIRLTELAGYDVIGMAYPCTGGDDRVADILRRHTKVRYSRSTHSTYSFDLQENLMQFNPTVYHHKEMDKMFELGRQFLALEADRPQIFYIWGHAYEFDIFNDWGRMEEFCAMMAGRDDIFYGTNSEILLAPHN